MYALNNNNASRSKNRVMSIMSMIKQMRYVTSLGLLYCSLAQAEVIINSTGNHAQLIELYTSEGCSSCPPADRWLSKLETHPDLWKKIIPVAFHVDYWNYIGWHDRFSSKRFSARQRYYAANDNLDSVYTPGFLINGKEWRGFFKRRQLPDEFGRKGMGDLQLTINEMNIDARFQPVDAQLHDKLYLNVAILGFDIETNVGSGENRNRKLVHDFVVLGYKALPLTRQHDYYSAMSSLPDTVETSARTAIAAWINKRGNPTPLQAAGGWLR